MKVKHIIWLPAFEDKLLWKHNVLAIEYVYKTDGAALIISARDMDKKEKRRYGRK